jgi:uncharacterized protein YjbI with pentapeptide repeats
MHSLDHVSPDNETPQQGDAHQQVDAHDPRVRGLQADDGAAAKADDIEAIRKTVEDAAAVSTGLWISYLFTLFYIVIAVGAVSHLDLLLESPVKLPFLGIELPLLTFFFVTPLLFLTVHAYTLVHFVMLGKKSVQFHNALYAHFPRAQTGATTAAEDPRNREIREGIRRQLPSNIFVQFLAGPSDVRDSGFGWLLRAIAWVTLVLAPIALLFELQVQFLPFHNLLLTWEHRLAVLLDIVLIWWLWGKILGDGGGAVKNWRAPAKTIAGGILSIIVVWLSFSLATIPGEWQVFTGYAPLHRTLFHGFPDPNTHRPASLFSNILVLPYLNVYDILKVDDPQKVAWRDHLLSLRGRDLRGAIFDEAFLERTDAQSVQLQGASLSFVHMQGSKLDEAGLEGANLSNAQLQGASLLRAQLQGAELSGAGLQGAKLELANFVGADLANAQLQGANLRNADLRGADFTRATLRGTSFANLDKDIAQLQGTIFDQAILDTVSLKGALLWRASFAVDRIANVLGTPAWTGLASWGANSYALLQDSLQVIPEPQRGAALRRIASIACATPPNTPVCIVPSPLPPEVIQWQDEISKAAIDKAAYQKALAAVYTDIICSGDGNSLAIFRSLVNMGMPQAAGGTPKPMGFLETGGAASALVENVLSAKCHVSGQLTESDKATLLEVERFSVLFASNVNMGVPPPTPQIKQ